MRAIIGAAVAAATLALAQTARADATGDRLERAADDCIRTASAQVVAQSASLSDAVTFLVDDLCAPDIRHAEAYQRNVQLLGVLRTRGKDSKDAAAAGEAALDPKTGDLTIPGDIKGNGAIPLMLANWFGERIGAGAAQARFRSVAAHAVLEAHGPGRR
ncbi:MAG TPA: hypothetical protein VGS12_09200 [Caulobacteraceae bacterium]|nr:hypothetical protein [Caulobacteraceae bacterium]